MPGSEVDRQLAPSPPLEGGEATVGGDLVQPGADETPFVQAADTAPRPDKAVLHGVFGVVQRAEHPVTVGLQLAAVRRDQLLERRGVTGSSGVSNSAGASSAHHGGCDEFAGRPGFHSKSKLEEETHDRRTADPEPDTALGDGRSHRRPAAVLADHAPDIVMFDVPPPYQGVRGIDAYRDTWPGFFQWQAAGAVFEIESLEVTAGAEVAFAFALLRCGTPADFERDPDYRLRLTIGLRKVGDRWTVPTSTTRSSTRPGQRIPPRLLVRAVARALVRAHRRRTSTG